MRKPVDLTAAEKDVANGARALLPAADSMVTVTFKKQDDTIRALAGRLVEVKGKDDKEVVIIETAEGYRSANLYRIMHIKAL